MFTNWKLGVSALASLLVTAASGAQAQDAPQEEGMTGSASASSEGEVSVEAGGGGGGGGRGTPLSVGSIALFGGMRLGVGGELDFDSGGDDDLLATFGLQLGGEYVLHQYFALGGEFRAAWLNGDNLDDLDVDRFKLFDFVVKPRGRYVIDQIGLEVYGTLPMGLTIPSLPDFGTVEVDGKAGFTLGVGAGVIYMFTDMIGINGEMAWYKWWFGSETDPGGVEDDLDAGQFNFIGNVYFVL